MKKIIYMMICVLMIGVMSQAIYAQTTISDLGVYSPLLEGAVDCSYITGAAADLCTITGGGGGSGGNCSIDQSCSNIIYWSQQSSINAGDVRSPFEQTSIQWESNARNAVQRYFIRKGPM